MTTAYFIGIDIGTQGSRVVLMDAAGNITGSGEETFPLNDRSREEQSPDQWWESCVRLLKSVIGKAGRDLDLRQIKAIAVTSTSGTVIPLDAQNRPLYNAIMYSDPRSAAEGAECQAAARRFHPEGYSGFNASSGLSKMVWFIRHFPGPAEKLAMWVHAADFITGQLSGRWGVTDETNALKSGYDVKNKNWPAWLFDQLPLQRAALPEVLPSGTPIGRLSPSIAALLGLGGGVQVVTGMTDGCASQIASGATSLGDWNTTIGTTMVIKGVTREEIKDPEDRIYCHRHPEGFWMPGGASNTGADWVAKEFGRDPAYVSEQARLQYFSEQAGLLIPTGLMAWPLRQNGERFPFIAPQARGFGPPDLSETEQFAANMEGVAYIERYAYEMIQRLSGEKVKAVFTAGGGSNSDTWLTIRSNVLNLPLYKMRQVTGAAGAAILAASKTHFASVMEAGRAMTQMDREVHPAADRVAQYEEYYQQFVRTLREKGYITVAQQA